MPWPELSDHSGSSCFLMQVSLHFCGEDCCGQTENLAIRHQGSSDLKKHLSRRRQPFLTLTTGSASGAAWGTACGQAPTPMSRSKLSTHSSGFCLSTSAVTVPGLGLGRVHTQRRQSQLGLDHRAFPPVTWDLPPSPTGWWWPLSPGEAPPHTLLWP